MRINIIFSKSLKYVQWDGKEKKQNKNIVGVLYNSSLSVFIIKENFICKNIMSLKIYAKLRIIIFREHSFI